RAPGAAAFPVLLHLGVHRGGQAVDDDRAPTGLAVGADHAADAVLEPRIEIAIEQVDRLHDVHVAVNEAKPVFHDVLPGVALSPLSPVPAGATISCREGEASSPTPRAQPGGGGGGC